MSAVLLWVLLLPGCAATLPVYDAANIGCDAAALADGVLLAATACKVTVMGVMLVDGAVTKTVKEVVELTK